MSLITNSLSILSVPLEQFGSPEIILKSSSLPGGYIFGPDVTVLTFRMSGYTPFLMQKLRIWESGNDNSSENS